MQENALLAVRRCRRDCDDTLRRNRQERHWAVQQERAQCDDDVMQVSHAGWGGEGVCTPRPWRK